MDFKRVSGLVSIALGVAFIVFSVYFIQGEEISSTRGSGLRLFLVLGIVLLIAGIVNTFSRKEEKRAHFPVYFVPKVDPCFKKSDIELHELIAKRAYELYEQRGLQAGLEEADWLQAEEEIRKKLQL